MDSLRHALKEWAVAVEGAGARRDGARGPQGRHQGEGLRRAEDALSAPARLRAPEARAPQDEYRGMMDEIPDLTDDGPLRFSSFAEVEGAYEVSEAEDLAALDPHHMWTPEYAESRFKWRPEKAADGAGLADLPAARDGRARLPGRVRGVQVLDRARGSRLRRGGATRAVGRGVRRAGLSRARGARGLEPAPVGS